MKTWLREHRLALHEALGRLASQSVGFALTVLVIGIAAFGYLIVEALRSPREERERLLHRISPFFLPMLAMPFLGAWYAEGHASWTGGHYSKMADKDFVELADLEEARGAQDDRLGRQGSRHGQQQCRVDGAGPSRALGHGQRSLASIASRLVHESSAFPA